MKILVIGAGFSGATTARLLAEAGHEVVINEARLHVGGNAYDRVNEYGIRTHTYGPHLFHTKMKHVWDFLNRFGEWAPYEHRVKALLADGTFVPFPPNSITRDRVPEEKILDVFYRPYTRKMWNKELEEVAPGILSRVPGRTDEEDRYFPNDLYQGIPLRGYTDLIDSMLDHENILLVSLGFRTSRETIDSYLTRGAFDHVFTSQSIDEYHDYRLGVLPYRSIRFTEIDVPLREVLPVTTVNFTHDEPVTRVTEWKHLPSDTTPSPNFTTLTYEEPYDFSPLTGPEGRYYPLQDEHARSLYESYRAIETPNVTFIGRCGKYTYIDMDQAVNQAMQIVTKFLRDRS